MLINKNCYGLPEIGDCSIDTLIVDPPYGISYQNKDWDKSFPDEQIWRDCLRVLKPGAFGLVFSSIRLQHHLAVALEIAGFQIKDVLLWVYLNGMPKTRNIGLEIDKKLKIKSEKVGVYKYVQGYKAEVPENYKSINKDKFKPKSDLGKKYDGFGMAIKPSYEPIILIQKPLEGTLIENIMKYGVGAINLEETRIPYENNEGKVGHNPHPNGRVMANIIRTKRFGDGYDKFFVVPKVRQHKDDFNNHPTVKPVELMVQLVKLLTVEGQIVLDCFMGSGSTGVAALLSNRKFIGYETDKNYFAIASKRISQFNSIPYKGE